MSIALVFKKKVRIGEDKTVLDTYLLHVTIEKLVLDYSVALQWPYAVLYLIFFFYMACLITYRLLGAFFLDDHSLLATILTASVGNNR